MEYTEYTVSPTVSLQVACYFHHFHCHDTSLVEVWQLPWEPPEMPSKRSGPGSSLEMRDGLPLDLHPSSNIECPCASLWLHPVDEVNVMRKTLVCFTLAAIWRSSRSRGFRRCILHLKPQPMIDTRCVLIQLSQFRLLCKKWKNMLRTCLTHWETRNLSNEASVQNVQYLCPQSSLFHVVPRISQNLGKHLRLCVPEPLSRWLWKETFSLHRNHSHGTHKCRLWLPKAMHPSPKTSTNQGTQKFLATSQAWSSLASANCCPWDFLAGMGLGLTVAGANIRFDKTAS